MVGDFIGIFVQLLNGGEPQIHNDTITKEPYSLAMTRIYSELFYCYELRIESLLCDISLNNFRDSNYIMIRLKQCCSPSRNHAKATPHIYVSGILHSRSTLNPAGARRNRYCELFYWQFIKSYVNY